MNHHFIKRSTNGEQFNIRLENNYSNFNINLTKKQTEIMFYLLRGKTPKYIANCLNISFRTVEKHIEHIKKKAVCHSRSELIEKYINDGAINLFPKHLLRIE